MTEHLARRAASFSDTGSEYHRLRPPYLDAVVDWLLPAKAKSVVELGAGTGRLTDSLVERAQRVVAVDPSASMLAVLSARLPQVEVVQATAEETGLANNSFDAAVIAQAWHWVDPVAGSAEAARLLRPGGTLAMVWNQRIPTQGWQEEFDALQDAKRGADLVDDIDSAARPPFDGRAELHRTWSREVSPEDFLHSYTTHSPFLVAEPQEQGRRLRRWRELLDANAGPRVTEVFHTTAWRFRLPG